MPTSGGGKNFLVSAAGFSILGNGIFWWKAKTKMLFSQCTLLHPSKLIQLLLIQLKVHVQLVMSEQDPTSTLLSGLADVVYINS
jgi:hypothetical protein